MSKVIIITGQTATGKTNYALELAKKYNGELINADSRQIYKHLDVITGKDIDIHSKFRKVSTLGNFDIGYYQIAELLNGSIAKNNVTMKQGSNVKLWLYDIVDPKVYFSSFDFVQCAVIVIKDILKRHKTPIIVGGTYFYLYHLLYDVPTQSIPADWDLRNRLNNQSVLKLQKIIVKLSKPIFNTLNQSDKSNPQRLIRKIEILTYQKKHHLSLTPLNIFLTNQSIKLNKKLCLNIGIEYHGFRYSAKEELKNAIKSRVEKRLKNGALQEVKELLKKGYKETDAGLKTIGYKQIISYLKNNISKKQAIEEWITREIQYAKRQYTFMKRDPHIKWNVCNIISK